MKNKGQKLPNSEYSHEDIYQRSSTSSKVVNLEEIHTKIHYSLIVKNKIQRKNFENSKKKITYYMESILNKINNWFTIRNHGGKKAEG